MNPDEKLKRELDAIEKKHKAQIEASNLRFKKSMAKIEAKLKYEKEKDSDKNRDKKRHFV